MAYLQAKQVSSADDYSKYVTINGKIYVPAEAAIGDHQSQPTEIVEADVCPYCWAADCLMLQGYEICGTLVDDYVDHVTK